MNEIKGRKRIIAMLLALTIFVGLLPIQAFAAAADATLTASLNKAKTYIDGITINNSSNDPEKVVTNFKTHFTWDNEKRENSKSYLFDWSYYNGVVFEGIEYLYEVTGESVYKNYVIEYMSSMITSSGSWAKCTNNTSKQAAGYDSTHGADCYKTASLLMDCYEMTGDSRYLTIAETLYADLDKAAKSYSLSKAGNNFRHTWASDPSPDLWLDGLYMILPFRAEYAKHIGDTEELDLIVSRMQWVSDNMYNSSKGLFYHAADSASSNSGTYWLRSIGWYAAAIVDIMDSMEGSNLEAMKVQLKKLVDGMKACQNASNGMWLNNMDASQSASNPYETSGTALTCYAVMKAVNNGWLDESYADMAILAFNGICNEKLSGSNLKDICFKGAPGSSNSTFYDNEGKGVGPFIMFYAEVLEYVNKADEEPEATEPEATEPEVTEPEATEPEVTTPSEPEQEQAVYTGKSNLEGDAVYTLDNDGINSGEKYLIVYSGKALQNNNGEDNNPTVTVSNNTITLSDDSTLAWTITLQSGSNYYVENNDSYLNLTESGNDPIGSKATVNITGTYKFRNVSSRGAYLRYSSSQLFCAGTNDSANTMSLYRRTSTGTGSEVVFTLSPAGNTVKPGSTLALNGTVTVAGKSVNLNNCTIAWSSSNNDIATVSGDTVTGLAAGNAVITATISAVNGTALKNNIILTVPVTVQGHNYESVIIAPTCNTAGYTTYTCSICGDSYVTDEVEALGHDMNSVITEATCTTDGYTTHTCCRCGEVTVDSHVDALGHATEVVTVEPTCTADGYKSERCTRCGDTSTQVLPAQGHKYEAVVTAPTCETAGYTTYTCSCGDTYIAEETDALDHKFEAVTITATCTSAGSVTYTCVCGETYTEVVPALGHKFESVVTAPTCESAGYTTYTCTNCGDSYVADETAALGHKFDAVTVAATCNSAGSVTYTCVCGETYTEVVPALGHKFESVVTAPTCESVGFTTNTCANCGDSNVTDEVEALGHSYNTTELNGVLIHTCDNCGDSYTETLGWICLSNIYKLDTDGIDVGADHKYIIVGSSSDIALALSNGSVGCMPVEIQDQRIILDQVDALEFYFVDNGSKEKNTYLLTQDGTKGVYHMNGNMYYGNNTRGYWYIGSNKDGAYQIYDYDNLNWYLNYGYVWATDTVNRFSVSSNVRNVRMYQKDERYARLAGAVNQNVTDADEVTVASILEQISIQLSENSNDITETIAVTESMLTWNENFDSTTAGIYSASVTYMGTEIGVVTVTVTSKHSYVTEVVDPTCTEDGYTVRTCSECGICYIDAHIEALGHSYTCVESPSMRVYTCVNCGDSYEELRYDVHSASFTASSVKKNLSATLIIETTENVESIMVRNAAGKVESITVKSVNTVDGVKTWTVTFRIKTTGNKTFTITGYGTNGETGDTAIAGIKVTR